MSISEIPVHTETTVDSDDDGPFTFVNTSVFDSDDRHHTASAHLAGQPTDEQIAAALLCVARAAAHMHSSGAWIALERMLAGPDGKTG